ncbi:hypothetical protein J4481_02580 [Candidatus Pacearchaeota archaeon]|nr:hypothetical protein [Candidatus Pacearchaeota archaeon]
MYKKYLVVASKKDRAGINITTALSQYKRNPVFLGMQPDKSGFDFYLCDEEIIRTENLDLNRINKYDFVIFASKHQSEKKEKSLSIHAPGNWSENSFGGERGKVCRSSGLFQKQMFDVLNKFAKEHKLNEKYSVTMECTHHGPLINKPCVFIEVGSTEEEWNDRRACFVIAKTISKMIDDFEENPYREVAIGIGGPHYCPNFNKLQLNSNVAFSHVIPSYVLPLTEDMIKEAMEKTEEDVEFVVLDWKGIGNAEERQRIVEILEKNYIRWKKTGEVGK